MVLAFKEMRRPPPWPPEACRPGPTPLLYIPGIQVYAADIHPPAPGRRQHRPAKALPV